MSLPEYTLRGGSSPHASPLSLGSLILRHALAALMTATILSQPVQAEERKLPTNHPYAGMWVTDDGRVRHELLPTGRYIEARGTRERAYEGRYQVTGTHIEYWDDTGFTADGDFADTDTLHHGGMILRRRVNPAIPQ